MASRPGGKKVNIIHFLLYTFLFCAQCQLSLKIKGASILRFERRVVLYLVLVAGETMVTVLDLRVVWGGTESSDLR